MGPRQTKCEIREETVHVDFDDYVSTLTTTRTPDVPGGGIFAIVVTTQVDWTGRSFIKGLINSSALDGQKVYHTELEKAMRAYIQEHQSEFILEGMAPPEIEPPVDVAPLDPPSEKKGEQKRNRRGCIADFWESSTSTTILYALIGVLVVSNVWTYVRVGSTVDGVGRKMKEPAKVGSLEVNVGGSCQSGCC
ncbi:hypothetical protein B0H17DRAFT_1091778 [Mycena rosella]|uniref:VASt domain-containing protein n=1 Tax=Mycena rosella TaxID=1033263 RepID=A0AAD7CUK9_MYCRO|nr:hypothetical protein B0H17DRAFT_1091778 [Mycena rosella]